MRVVPSQLGVLTGAAVALLLAAWPAAAQSRIVSGTTRDLETGEAIPHAIVTVVGRDIRAVSNVDGRFALLGVPEDDVVIAARVLGYEPSEHRVAAGKVAVVLDLALRRLPLVIDTIHVVAEAERLMKTGEDVSVVHIAPATLSQLPNLGEADIFRSLQLLPGISGTSESSASLYVRGGTPDQNLVLLDGMTVYHLDHFYGFFSAFNADAIKDVKVYKGAYPAAYGGRLSSIVDLTGKTGDIRQFRYGGGLSLLSADAYVQVPIAGRGSFVVTGRRSFTDIIRTSLYNDIFGTLSGGAQGGTTPANQLGGPGPFGNASAVSFTPTFYFYDANAKLTYFPSGADVVSLSFYTGRDNLDNSRDLGSALPPGAPAGAAGTGGTATDLTDWKNVGVSAKWSRQWGPQVYSNLLLAASRYTSLYDRATARLDADSTAPAGGLGPGLSALEDNRINDLTLRLDNDWHATPHHMVSGGTWVTRAGVRFAFLRDDTTQVLDLDQGATQLSFYLQDAWRIAAPATLSLGLRTALYSGTEQSFLEPRASLVVHVTSRLHLKAAYGKYSQFVSQVTNENIGAGARDFWLLAGDEVPVSRSTHYVLGTGYETAGWLFDAELYRKDMIGLSEFSLRFRPNAGFTPSTLFFNGTARSQGVELLVQKKTGLHTGWISYTLASARNRFPGLNDGEEFPALHDQRHEIKLVNTLAIRGWNLSASWVFGSGKPYTAPESEYTVTLLDGRQETYIHVGEKNAQRLPAYHRLDLSASRAFRLTGHVLEAGVSVFNVYNRANIWYREFDLTEVPALVTDVMYLGITPSVWIRLHY
jgi:hypothetical protein